MTRRKQPALADSRQVARNMKSAISQKKHGIKESDARRIIKQHGGDRDAADRAANRLRG
jgi:hypothetical protein